MASCTKWALVVLLLLSFCELSFAHSFILEPKGDFLTFNKAECRMGGPDHSPDDKCKGPCFSKDSWQYNELEGTTTYERGDNVNMIWTRNNHRGGFVRFTLVPESQRMNKTAHDAFAFRYACYESDRHDCEYDTSEVRKCGTDVFTHRTKVEIPTSLEDGYYTLGWAWYGGVNFYGKSYFGDYWSCSRIYIKGGPLTESYTPIFNPGENMKSLDPRNPTCKSSTDRLGDCAVEPCSGRDVFQRVPKKFEDGKTPAPILRSWTQPTTNRKAMQPSPTKTPEPRPDGPRSKPSLTPKAFVAGLRLVDVDTEDTLASVFEDKISIPRHTKGLSFVAKVRGDAKLVRFYINDEFVRVEKELPFSSFGDLKGKLYSWPKPIFDKWVRVKVVVVGIHGRTHEKTFNMFLIKNI